MSLDASSLEHPPLRLKSVRLLFDRTIAIALPLIIWQLAALNPGFRKWSSSPIDVAIRLYDMVLDGSLTLHTWQTLQETVLGLVIGTVAGTVFGILLGRSQRLSEAIDPVVMGLYSLPRVALAPLFLIWLGIGLSAKVGLIVSVVLFVVLLTVREGVKSIDVDLVNAFRTMNASRSVMLRYVTLPSLLPWIVASVKIAIGASLIGAVVAEMVGSSRGLGWLVNHSTSVYDMTGSMTALVILGILAMLLNAAVGWMERKVLFWRDVA